MKIRKMILPIALTILMTLTSKAEYVTSVDGLRLRKEPSLKAEVIKVLPYGSKVDIKDKVDKDWLEVEGGFVCADYISEDPGMEYLGNWRITAYAETGNCCANGSYPQVGYTIACNSLPFGTKVYIEGVGVRVVEDRGPTWLGDEWADLYLGYVYDCIIWGNQYRDVYLVKEDTNEQE